MITIGYLRTIGVLSDREVDVVMGLAQRHAWFEPATTSFELEVATALQCVRRAYTLASMQHGGALAERMAYCAPYINLTMLLLQGLELGRHTLGFESLATEHAVTSTTLGDAKLVCVPANFSIEELQAYTEMPNAYIVMRDVKYTNTIPE